MLIREMPPHFGKTIIAIYWVLGLPMAVRSMADACVLPQSTISPRPALAYDVCNLRTIFQGTRFEISKKFWLSRRVKANTLVATRACPVQCFVRTYQHIPLLLGGY